MAFNIIKKLPFIAPKQSIEEFIAEMNTLNANTPDYSILESFRDLLLFVPDEMRRGYSKYDLLKDNANYKATAFTEDPFFFFIKDLGEHSHPVALRHLPTGHILFPPEPARIKGELFRVDATHFKNLDEYRENGVQFERRRVQITIPNRLVIHSRNHPLPKISDIRLQTITSYMYVGVQDYWNNLIGGAFPAKTARLIETASNKWIDKYYFYAKGNEL